MTTDAQLSEELQRQYSRRFTPLQKYRQEVWSILVRDFFQEIVGLHKSILDLGCGWGEFINHIEADKKIGMDLNPSSSGRLQPDVQFIQQDCSVGWQVAPESLDVVFTSNFFEHLPNKEALKNTLAEAWKTLKPGGKMICMGPNIKYSPGIYWDFLDHHIALTELSLSEGLELCGFEIERCEDRFLPYTMVGADQPPLWMLKLYLKLPLLWRWKGKQFLVVARKPLKNDKDHSAALP